MVVTIVELILGFIPVDHVLLRILLAIKGSIHYYLHISIIFTYYKCFVLMQYCYEASSCSKL